MKPASIPSRRVLGWLASGLALALVSVAGEHAYRAVASARSEAGSAVWIWRQLSGEHPSPSAFYALKDFPLGELPGSARLAILADEEYVVSLNGERIGSGRYEEGAGLDVYDVTGELLVGGNRLLVELRSGWGRGGLLAALQAREEEGRRDLVVTDGSWRIVPADHLGLDRGWLVPRNAEPPQVWGPTPTGRWGLLGASRPLPLWPALAGAAPQRATVVSEAGRPAAVLRLPEEVVGYLTLELLPASSRLGLVYPGTEAAPGKAEEPAVVVVAMPGDRFWRDSQPRLWSTARVQGLDGLRGAVVQPVDPELVEVVPAQFPAGVFGVSPPPQRTPVKDAVRARLGQSSSDR